MWSTIATLSGELVVVGGRQSFLQVNSIYHLIEGEWVKIGSMSSGREACFLVTTSPDRMVIVSGIGGGNSVEECVVVSAVLLERITELGLKREVKEVIKK